MAETSTLDVLQVPADLTTISDADLAELAVQVEAAARNFSAVGVDALDADDQDNVIELGQVFTAVRGEQAARLERSTAVRGALATFSTAAPAVPVVVEPAASAPVEPPPAVTDDAALTAGATGAPSVAQIAGRRPRQIAESSASLAPLLSSSHTRLLAAAPLRGLAPGAEFGSINDVASAFGQVVQGFGGIGPGQYQRFPLATFAREYPEDLQITSKDSRDSALEKLENVAKQSRLPGGSLVAAAGWCAPSQILYDLFETEDGTDGILDLPELQITRGGVQVTPGPDFSSIFSGAGYWHYTEAQVIAATSKPTMVVPCPSFTDNRLEVEGVQITGAFLQDKGYPEMVNRFIRGAMIAHQRKLNIYAINAIAAGSTLVDYTNVVNLPITTTEYKDLTVLSRMLAVMGIQIMDYRYKYRYPFDALMSVVLPYWVIESVRADLQRKTAMAPAEAYSVSQGLIESWFAERGARVQWVYDWQDAYNVPGSGTNTSTNLGSATVQYQLPTTLYAIMYGEGTFVRGVADVIRLDTVYDSTNLALNQYIKLFTEDGVKIIKRGLESRMIKMTIDPSGTTSATSNMVTG
jgi:hypothetical protein